MLHVPDRGRRRGHVVDAVDRPVHLQRLNDVMADQREVLIALEVRNVGDAARDEVVDANDRMPLREQEIGQVRAQKAGGAGNQNAHGSRVKIETGAPLSIGKSANPMAAGTARKKINHEATNLTKRLSEVPESRRVLAD